MLNYIDIIIQLNKYESDICKTKCMKEFICPWKSVYCA